MMIYIKPLVSRCCVANLTRMLQTSSFNQTHVLVASKQYFPFLLGGENIHNYFIKSIASSHHFTKSIASSRCVEDTPGKTLFHALVDDKYSPALRVSRKLRPKSKTIPCYTSDCFKSSCLPFVPAVCRNIGLIECVWFCNVTPDLYHTTYIALTELAAWLEWLLNHPQ